ncbi:MAG: hypothetical protein KGJ13_08555, partial [Patescibacteria group bacterium]|nr:hypothetical protein [Patescibacteria group bacterium]
AGRQDWFWNVATHATRTASMAWSLVNNATVSEYARLSAPGAGNAVNFAIHAGTAPTVPTSGTQAIKLYLIDATTTPAIGVAANFTATTLDCGAWQMLRGRGSNASPAAIQSGDAIGEIQWDGYYSTTSTSFGQGAVIRATATETWTSSANGTNLFFYLATTGTTIAEKMSLRNTGTLRINATSGSFDTTTLLQVGNYGSWSVNVTAAIYAQANGTTPLQVIGTSGQTANVFQVFNDALSANLFVVNSVGVASVRLGLNTASGGKANVGGVANVNITSAANVGAAQTDLITYSLPASALGTNGDRVEVQAFGAFNTNVNAKRLKMFFGSTAIFDTGSLVFNGGAWYIYAVITRFGAAVQTAISVFDGNLTLVTTNCQETVPTETMSSAITIKCTGQGTNNSDVIQDEMIVNWYPNA